MREAFGEWRDYPWFDDFMRVIEPVTGPVRSEFIADAMLSTVPWCPCLPA